MKKLIIAIAAAIVCIGIGILHAQDTAQPIVKTHKEVRFQIVQVDQGNGAMLTLKIDTLTGQTWHLQFTGEEERKRGVYYVWTEIPTFLAPDLTKPAAPISQ